MPSGAETEVREAVEAVARADERVRLKHSPFHLVACSGCGAPSFGQPCPLCGYYPMGTHKGTWHPKRASYEDFRRMVDRSGPGGEGGTIATWHARNVAYPRTAERSEEVARLAASVVVPDAGTVWDVVAVGGRQVVRDLAPTHVRDGWSGLSEANWLVIGEIGKGAPRLAPEMTDVLREWVAAVHGEDRAGMQSALERGLELCRRIEAVAGRSGNLSMAIDAIKRAVETLPPEVPLSP